MTWFELLQSAHSNAIKCNTGEKLAQSSDDEHLFHEHPCGTLFREAKASEAAPVTK